MLRVTSWIVIAALWVIAIAALTVVLMLPGDLDVFYHDTYVVVARLHVVLGILLLLILPLLVLTVWRLRSTSN